jgi:hypothetical protein
MRRFAMLLALTVAAYAGLIRPRLLRWGATDEEFNSPFPRADLVPGGTRSATMAVTIDAPPSKVWPWLVQMGYGRAGWYSWDYLDNFGRPSSTTLHREWQNIEVGEYLAGPHVSALERKAWQVAALEPERFLGLRSRIPHSESLWAFWLKDIPGGRTRLIVSGYWNMQPRWLQPFMSFGLLEWTHWIMQTKQFAELKRRAERQDQAAAFEVPTAAQKSATSAAL